MTGLVPLLVALWLLAAPLLGAEPSPGLASAFMGALFIYVAALLRRLDEIYRAIWHLDSKKEDRW